MSGLRFWDELQSRREILRADRAMQGYAGAAVALTLSSIFFLVFHPGRQTGDDASSGSETHVASSGEVRPAQSRLPRPRPDAPRTTGSITPKPAVPGRRDEKPVLFSAPAALDALRLKAAAIDSTDLAAGMPELLSEAQAVGVCERKLRDGLAVPGSFERASSQYTSAPGGGALVSFDFAALNGLGFPFHMHAECILDGGRIARLEVEPR